MSRITRFLCMSLAVILLSGCSVYMAAKQPERKNVDLFKEGTHRNELLAEYGNPTISEEKDGKKVDVYRFRQGYSGGAKAGRAMFHGAADVLTLGLWEVVGTPIEAVADGDDVAYQVEYDDSSRVKTVTLLSKSTGR